MSTLQKKLKLERKSEFCLKSNETQHKFNKHVKTKMEEATSILDATPASEESSKAKEALK